MPYNLNPATLSRKAMRILSKAMSGKPVEMTQLKAAETTIRVFSESAHAATGDSHELGFQFTLASGEQDAEVANRVVTPAPAVKMDAQGIELYGRRKQREFKERGKRK